MSSNYAFIPNTLTETTELQTTVVLPVYKEIAIDFDTGTEIFNGNDYKWVIKNEAVKVWIYKALNTSRYTYLAYSTNYGNEIHTLIGRYLEKQILYSELRRMIEEALKCNPYITSLTDFDITQNGSKVTCNFSVNTLYGNVAQAYTYEV